MQWLNKIKDKIDSLRSSNQSTDDQPCPKTTAKEPIIPGTTSSHRKSDVSKSKAGSRRQKKNYIANFSELVDIVEQDGETVLLIKSEDDLEILSSIKIKGKTYFPPPIEKIPWLLSSADDVIEVYESERMLSPGDVNKKLYEDLRLYLKNASDLPSEKYYDLITSWVLHTYLYEKSQFSPIIWLFGDPEKGKSRTGKAMAYASHRGIIVESLSQAYLLRAAGDLGASIFIDVIDLWRKAKYAGSEDVIMQRIEKGVRVPRVLFPDKGAFDDTRYFQIYGPTIIGTNCGIDHILQTRAIQIIMQETERTFENHVTEEAAIPFRSRLLAFRARYLHEELPIIPKPAKRRLGDISQPLLQIIKLAAPHRTESFLSLLSEIEAARLSQKSCSLEAEALQAIISLKEELRNGILPVKNITETMNQERLDKHKLSPQKIGWTLTSLGIERSRATKNGGMAIVWNQRQIEQLMAKYGLKESSDSSESSESGSNTKMHTEETDVSEELNLPF